MASATARHVIPLTTAHRKEIDHEEFELQQTPQFKNLLNDNEAAIKLGVSPATLRSWRCRGIGPPFIKLGSSSNASVRYNPIDLDDFLRRGRHVPSVRAASEE